MHFFQISLIEMILLHLLEVGVLDVVGGGLLTCGLLAGVEALTSVEALTGVGVLGACALLRAGLLVHLGRAVCSTWFRLAVAVSMAAMSASL